MTQPHFNPATGRWELPGDQQHHHPQGWAPRPMVPPRTPASRPPLVNTAARPPLVDTAARPPLVDTAARPASPPPAPPSGGVPPVPRPVPLTGSRPPRPSRRWPWVAGIVVAFLVGLAIPTGGSTGDGSVTSAASGAPVALDAAALPSGPAVYSLEVTTAGTTTIGHLLWNNGEGGMETRDDRAAPFRQSVTVPADRPWTTVQVSAQLPIDADASASITCVIKDADGRALDTQTSRGLYAVASCNSAGL